MNVAQGSYCPLPCTTMSLTFGIPIISKIDIGKNEAYMKLYFKNQINVRSSIYSYSIPSLIADIGGYLGILLGFSLLDLCFIVKQKMN